jgi:hypothetical protein
VLAKLAYLLDLLALGKEFTKEQFRVLLAR